MNSPTTVNIRISILKRINDSAARLNISRTRLVSLLLTRALEWNQKAIQQNMRVRYQTTRVGKKWHKLHVVFGQDVYEACLDMRKLYKMSVSLILAVSVREHLDEIEKGFYEKVEPYFSDNYYPAYVFISKMNDGIHYFTISWGLPDQKTLQNMLL